MRAAVPGLSVDFSGVFIVSGIFFRSAWKYRKRAYRYVLLDGGHLVENLRLAISAAGYDCRLHHAFDDRKIDELLGLDESREGSICCISISGGNAENVPAEDNMANLPETIQAASRVSSAEIVYPEIADIHEAAKIVIGSVTASESEAMIDSLGICPSDGYTAVPNTKISDENLNFSKAVFYRRSKRNFIQKPIENNQLNYILTLLCHASGQIDENPNIASSACIGFLARNVNGVDPGFYLLDPVVQKTGRIFAGNAIEKMTAVCLDQAWLKNAAVHFVFLSNLEMLENKWGARGYRYAMMTAGRLGHCVYLGATALGLGCCGIGAIYDDEARQLLGLNDASALLYLVAAGNTR
jgi:SagB-type dehydrogenase family enzyme